MNDFKHTPPITGARDFPLRTIQVNDEWAAHVQGLFSIATGQDYWASDIERAADDAIDVEQIIAAGVLIMDAKAHCHVRRITNQTIPHNSLTHVDEFTEIIDTLDLFDAAADDRIQLPLNGIWLVGAEVRWDANAVGKRVIILNPSVAGAILQDVRVPTTANFDHAVVGKINVLEPDFIRLRLQQTSGGDLDIVPIGVRSIDLWVHYLGEL